MSERPKTFKCSRCGDIKLTKEEISENSHLTDEALLSVKKYWMCRDCHYKLGVEVGNYQEKTGR